MSLLLAFLLGQGDPEQAKGTFMLPAGFQIDLAASEPDVVDPVAMAFDEEGRLYVVEMPGYPNAGVAEGRPREPGRIKRFENPEGARYRKCSLFATGLNFPTSVMPWKKGVLVANAPDLLYIEDSDDDGKADLRRVLYSGFGCKNIQAQLNGLQWGLDNWVHALGAGNGGEITCPGEPGKAPVSLGGRSFRFRPDLPGSLEPETGGGQYGLAADDWGNWFTCQNPAHLKQVVLPDAQLARNPHLSPPPAVIDIPDHGAAARLHRVSAHEAWRVERTARRAGGTDRSRFPGTELVPGGYVTSASGITIYRADLFPGPYRGNAFVCDPANNLIHRDILEPSGVTFTGRRAPEEQEREFLASTDNWFRPCFLTVGPDGALYVCDFNREMIETPLSLPEDIKAGLNLESRGRGRIWRIAPTGSKAELSPGLGRAATAELVSALAHPNAWWRMTAQRLLVQDSRQEALPALEELFDRAQSPLARLHALMTLSGLGHFGALRRALQDPDPGLRQVAVRTAAGRFHDITALADDPSPRVRFEVAFALGSLNRLAARDALAKLARRDGGDPYARAAILSSVREEPVDFFTRVEGAPAAFRADLARMIGARLQGGEIAGLLALIEKAGQEDERVSSLRGLAQGLRQTRKKNIDLPGTRPVLQRLLASSSEPERKAAVELAALVRWSTGGELEKAAATALDESAPETSRVEAIMILGSGEFPAVSSTLTKLLAPRQSEAIQIAAVRALDGLIDPGVAGLLLENWRRCMPAVRERALDALFSRKERLHPLLEALKKGDVSTGAIDAQRRARLFAFPDKEIAGRARELLAGLKPDPKLIDQFKGALDLKGEASRGAEPFKKLCIACHTAGNEGIPIGPGLASVRENPPEQTLTSLLYPSLVVLPQFVQYIVETTDGQVLNGILAESTAAAITLRRKEAGDARILRNEIKNLVSSEVSLMPEELLKGLSLQDVADLLAYLKEIK